MNRSIASTPARRPSRQPILSRIRIADERADLLDGLVEHRQKAILPILEEVVERLARHPRPGDHLGDGQARVADLLDRLRRSGQHAAALNLRYLSPRQTVGTGTQPWSRSSVSYLSKPFYSA